MWENLEETSETQAEAYGHGSKPTVISKVRVEIGNNSYFADEDTLVYELTGEQYDVYQQAETAFNKARVARDKALGTPVKFPKGICNFWILNVRGSGGRRRPENQ